MTTDPFPRDEARRKSFVPNAEVRALAADVLEYFGLYTPVVSYTPVRDLCLGLNETAARARVGYSPSVVKGLQRAADAADASKPIPLLFALREVERELRKGR